MNGNQIAIPASITINITDLERVLREATIGQAAPTQTSGPPPQTPTFTAKPKHIRKPKAEKPPQAPAEPAQDNVRLKVNPDDTIEDQVKSVIIQSAAHGHGDAVARKIFQSWSEQDTKAVTFCNNLFPGTTLETLAKAVIDATESELLALPRLFMSGLFQKAADLLPKAERVAVPKTPPCTICEGVSTHKAGCPIGWAQGELKDFNDGGAMPARVRNPEIAPTVEQPEPCAMGGPQGGCPIQEHGFILQGGAHIPVHPAEVMRKLRQATSGQGVTSGWNAPQPPEGAPKKRGRPKKIK